MKTVSIRLSTMNDVKDFVGTVTKFNCDFDLLSGRFIVDAKSIMGIFSLDLSKPLALKINAEDEAMLVQIENELKPYIEEK